jgi:hypothetical protein
VLGISAIPVLTEAMKRAFAKRLAHPKCYTGGLLSGLVQVPWTETGVFDVNWVPDPAPDVFQGIAVESLGAAGPDGGEVDVVEATRLEALCSKSSQTRRR